jgi:hypothetical protein
MRHRIKLLCLATYILLPIPNEVLFKEQDNGLRFKWWRAQYIAQRVGFRSAYRPPSYDGRPSKAPGFCRMPPPLTRNPDLGEVLAQRSKSEKASGLYAGRVPRVRPYPAILIYANIHNAVATEDQRLK